MLDFKTMQGLLERVTDPKRGSFYRTHYGLGAADAALNISSLEEWRSLPPVTKDALIASSLQERSYLPLCELDHLRASSGTSGKPPLFSPRTHVRNMEYRLEYHDFKNAFLAFTVPLMPHWHERFLSEHGMEPRVIAYDPKYPRASVRLAKLAGVDAVSVFLYHATALGEAMKAEGHNNNIRFLEVTGEKCNRATYEYLRETFPNATILQSYGASEVEDVHIGMPCRPMTGEEPLAVYHPKSTHYLELIDPETGAPVEPVAGAEGELLITAYPGEPSAFPLVRFRIGDMVRVVESACPRHGSWSFTVLGRAEFDFVKVLGGVLRADEVERVLRTVSEHVSDRFELHHFTRETEQGPKTQVVLHVEPKGEISFESLARHIAERLRVAPERTYADGVLRGAYLPLQCAELKNPGTAGKSKKLIVH